MKRVISRGATSPGFYADRDCSLDLHTDAVAHAGCTELHWRDRQQAAEGIAGWVQQSCAPGAGAKRHRASSLPDCMGQQQCRSSPGSFCLSVLILCKSFRANYDIVVAPYNQVRTTLDDASLLRLAHKIVEPIQRFLQPPVGDHASEARYSQHEQQHQYEDRESNLDQRKTPGSLHRGKLLVSPQITTAPAGGIFGVPDHMSQPRGRWRINLLPAKGVAVNCSKGDRLRPPGRIGAAAK